MEMKRPGKTMAQIMLSAGWDGPAFRSYLALQAGEGGVGTSLLCDIDRGLDSDPDKQPNEPAKIPRRKN